MLSLCAWYMINLQIGEKKKDRMNWRWTKTDEQTKGCFYSIWWIIPWPRSPICPCPPAPRECWTAWQLWQLVWQLSDSLPAWGRGGGPAGDPSSPPPPPATLGWRAWGHRSSPTPGAWQLWQLVWQLSDSLPEVPWHDIQQRSGSSRDDQAWLCPHGCHNDLHDSQICVYIKEIYKGDITENQPSFV